jgi:hemerythrin-like metal-binding protein
MSFETLHWKQDYETGVREIDLQHRFFMDLINRMHEELQGSTDADYRAALFEELSNYARFHFVSEENLMFKFGYPDLDHHRMMHRRLIDELSWRAQKKPMTPSSTSWCAGSSPIPWRKTRASAGSWPGRAKADGGASP